MNISIIGSGGVASILGRALRTAHQNISFVWSRTPSHAQMLATELGAKVADQITDTTQADCVLICVSDNAIGDIAEKLRDSKCVVAHTSGATPMEILTCRHRGVFYPCMTFSKQDKIDHSKIPFMLEWSDEKSRRTLIEMAHIISATPPTHADSHSRQTLHLAAVFASNFTNHLLKCATDILESVDMDIHVLEPLVRQTIDKTFRIGAFDAQTGPARRADQNTIKRHLQQLNDDKIRKIYSTLSDSIEHTYRTN